MTAQALLFTLSAIGISETAYLIKKRILFKDPFCPVGENCLAVLKSKYNKIFIIPNDILGLFFYLACAAITAFLVMDVFPLTLLSLIIKILIGVGSLISFFLTYLQFRVIKAWCFWCLMSAWTIWLMAVILLLSGI